MSPLRILLLAVLLYILYKLAIGQKDSNKKKSAGKADPISEDILVEDPVCHTYIPQKQAISLKHKGTTFHFCSESCQQTFLKDKGENNP